MPRFKSGDLVRILDLGKSGHVRIPWYVRHREGVIERYCGAYPNPEELAYARPGLPPVDLYRVRLPQLDIWAEYNGPAKDTLEIEVYDHWLEPANVKAKERPA
ncbi:MAG: SH3-like domain-containing protein [Rhodomicrobium sp.]